jgi:hypothetical protein
MNLPRISRAELILATLLVVFGIAFATMVGQLAARDLPPGAYVVTPAGIERPEPVCRCTDREVRP